MDLNNDGEITAEDDTIENLAEKAGASAEAIEKGTEYLFANDSLSNGLWDKEDSQAPQGQGDDDVQEIEVRLEATSDEAWFEYNGTKPTAGGSLDLGDCGVTA